MRLSRSLIGPRLGLAVAREHAEAFGGVCLSHVYVGIKKPLRWQCANGHSWEAPLANIRYKGAWCPRCVDRSTRQSTGLADAVALADKRGGLCLSHSYVTSRTHLLWRCAKGHRWNACLASVKHMKSWCPHCSCKSRLSLDVASSVAAKRGGSCLSKHYVANNTSLVWRCAQGHQWNATLNSVKDQGTWCPHCAGVAPLTLNDASELAHSRGGMCLSRSYTNSGTHLRWRCAVGHEWLATLTSIRNNQTWCPRCASCAPLNLGIAHAIAESNGGVCLSEEYVNTRTKLLWRCREGHKWSARLDNVKYGKTWCPECKSGKSQRNVRQIFETIFQGYSFPTRRPFFLRGSKGHNLELDGYCEQLGLAFEFNGEQHYNPDNFMFRLRWGSFEAIVARDRKKIELCKAAGVRLVVVSFAVMDRWNFIRLELQRWFPISAVFPVMISA
eukprot:TRINITY_DN26989_c0_g1_i1.p1 TRINITY_DN26989_c0_g1~~TRINITY_DN26989_c0_g1_i1.p1  ORF type:complete len:443 (+),score=16.13 TRINITY_DN26989_c0_g1_i1:258-1586(+)